MNEETKFIATCMKGFQDQILIHVPKDIVTYLNLERRDKVEITVKKTGMKNTRKIPEHPFGRP